MGRSLARFNKPVQSVVKANNGYALTATDEANKDVAAIDREGNFLGNNTPDYVMAIHDSSTANLYNITDNSTLKSDYYDFMPLCVKFDQDSTGAISINVNGWGTKTILYQNGDAFDDAKANVIYNLMYESVHGNFTT